jgi:hypothetical protein
MAKAVHFSIELELQKHLEMSFHMELTMEQMINQMNWLNFYLLQLRASKNENLGKDLSIIQCYKCRKMGHNSKECPNLPNFPIKKM